MRGSSIAFVAAAALVSCNKKEASKQPAKDEGSARAPAQVKKPVPTKPLPPLAKDPGDATGKARWAAGFGGLGMEVPRAVAIASSGDVYVAGYFDGETSFGPAGKHAAPGEKKAAQAYLVKVGADGKIAWGHALGSERDDVANGVATRGDTVVVVGNFLDRITLGEYEHKASGSDDVFVAALKTSGEPIWLWTAGSIDSDGANAVAATPDGGYVVGGSFSKTATFGTTDYKSRGGTDAMLIKLAASGSLEWVRQFGGRYNDKIAHVAVDPLGNIYVQGVFRDSAAWGGETLAASGAEPDVVLAKYDLNGDHIWSKRFGNAFEETSEGLAVDPAGNATIVGAFERSISFGEGDDHTSLGEADIYVAQFTTDGALKWARTYGAERDDGGVGVASDAAGNTVTTGWFEGSVDFGKGALASTGNKDVFALKLDASGGLVWAQNWGDKDHDQGRAVAIDGSGEIVVAGLYRFSLPLGSTPLESARAEGDRIPKADTFVVRLAR
jgi:hypothetical protein